MTVLPERNLDTLRSVAVLGVLIDHTLVSAGYGGPFVEWLGQAGVLAFFVHTSLVLMASLERDGAPERRHWIRRFYVRRAFRIYPLAWAVIGVALLLHVPRGLIPATYDPPSLSTVLANLGLVQNVAGRSDLLVALWTLPMEVQMYVALPFCYLVARTGSLRAILLLVLTAIALSGFYAVGVAQLIPGIRRAHVLDYVPCFVMGVGSYWLLRRRKAGAGQLPSWTWLPILVVLTGVLGTVAIAWPLKREVRILFCAAVGAAIPLVREAAPSVYTRLAHTTARYSYGIYLLHMLAIRAGFDLARSWPVPLQWLILGAVLAGGCYLCYHLIEKPGIVLGQRLASGRGGPPPLESTAPAP